MRPDEHKKKHRAEYKKKHGISNKKTTSKEKNETDKGTNSTESQENDALSETEEVILSIVVRLFKLKTPKKFDIIKMSCINICFLCLIRETRSSSQGEISQATGTNMKILKVIQ